MTLEARGVVLAVGACAVVGLVVAGALRGRDATDGPTRGTRLLYSMATPGVADRAAALEKAAGVLRDRLDERGESMRVTVADDMIAVELGSTDDEILARIEDAIGRRAHVELVIVDDDAAAMNGICDEARRIGAESEPPVVAEVDAWTDDRGGAHRDPYLRADDREAEVTASAARAIGCVNESHCLVPGRIAIERFVAQVTGGAMDTWFPPGRRLAYEHVDPPDHGRPYWRTYLVDVGGRIEGTAIAGAKTAWDPQTNRPQVWIQVAPAAAQLAEQTRAKAGRKLAVVLDDHVVSAPVINSAIAGTDLVLTMGAGSEREQEMDAVDIAAAVRAGSLPAPLVEESRHPFHRAGGGFLARSWWLFAAAGLIAAALVAYLVWAARVSASRSAGTPSRSA